MRKGLSCSSPPHSNVFCSLIWIWNNKHSVVMTIPLLQCIGVPVGCCQADDNKRVAIWPKAHCCRFCKGHVPCGWDRQVAIIGTIIWHEKSVACAHVRYHPGYSNQREPTLSFGARTKFLCRSWTEIWRQVQVTFDNWHDTLALKITANCRSRTYKDTLLANYIRQQLHSHMHMPVANCIAQWCSLIATCSFCAFSTLG